MFKIVFVCTLFHLLWNCSSSAPISTLNQLPQRQRNLATSLHFLNLLLKLQKPIDHGVRTGANFSLTCNLLAQYNLLQQISDEYEDVRTVLHATLQDSCLHFRSVFGPLPGNSSGPSNSSSIASSSGCGQTVAEQECCQLTYLQQSCDSHIKQSIKETSKQLLVEYSSLSGYSICDWIIRNRDTATNSLRQFFSFCL